MTQAVTNFYLFINRYRNGNFEQVKNEMDTTGDGVIQYSEVRSFIETNKDTQAGRECFLDKIEITGVNQIWNELDKTKRGFNSSATSQVSENGSLNASEEKSMMAKIELYGKIDQYIKAALSNLGLTDNVQGGAYEFTYNIDKDTLYYEASSELASMGNINQIMDDDNEATAAAEKAVKNAAAKIIKEQLLKKDFYKQNLIAAGLNDFSLSEDAEDLKKVIDSKINELIDSGISDLSQIAKEIAFIIRGYLQSAQVSIGWYKQLTPWNSSNGLNELQVERLKNEYRTNLTVDKVKQANPGIDYKGFDDALSEAIEKFIADEIEALDNTSEDFTKLLQKAQGCLIKFTQSAPYMALKFVIEMGTKPVNITDSNPLSWMAGMNPGSIEKLYESPKYKQYLQAAYKEIMAHPDEYGLKKDSDYGEWEKIRDAVMRYIKNHLDEILASTDCVKESSGHITKEGQTACILYYNCNNTSTTDSDEDFYNHAGMFVNYVQSTYSKNEYVMEVFDDKNLQNYRELSKAELASAMTAVKEAIEKNPETEIKIGEEPPLPLLDNIDSYRPTNFNGKVDISDMNMDLYIEQGGWLENEFHLEEELFPKVINKLTYPGKQCGFTQQEWENAKKTLMNYLKAVYEALANIRWNHEGACDIQDETKSFNINITYKNENTGEDEQFEGDVWAHSEDDYWDDEFMSGVKSGSSSSGLYVGCEYNWLFSNQFKFALDCDVLWEKFKSFLPKK